MTKAMPFLQKAILLSYDPRRLVGADLKYTKNIKSSHRCQNRSPAICAAKYAYNYAYGYGNNSYCGNKNGHCVNSVHSKQEGGIGAVGGLLARRACSSGLICASA